MRTIALILLLALSLPIQAASRRVTLPGPVDNLEVEGTVSASNVIASTYADGSGDLRSAIDQNTSDITTKADGIHSHSFGDATAGTNTESLVASDFLVAGPQKMTSTYGDGSSVTLTLTSAGAWRHLLTNDTTFTLSGQSALTNVMSINYLEITNPADHTIAFVGVDRWEKGFEPTMPLSNSLWVTLRWNGLQTVGDYRGPEWDQWVTLAAASESTNYIIDLSIPKQEVTLSDDAFVLHATNFPASGFSRSCVVKFNSNSSDRDFQLNSSAGFKTNAVNVVSNTIPSGWKFICTFSADGSTVDFNHAVQYE